MGWRTSVSFSDREVIDDTEVWQVQTREWGNTFWKHRIRTRVSEIRGCSRTAALSLTASTAATASKVTNSYGSAYFEHYSCTAHKRKANAADGWTVTFTERWVACYKYDGSASDGLFSGCAEHYFTDANPAVPGNSSGPNTVAP